MAREVRKFSVVVPAGTAQANPARFNLEFPPRIVRELQVRIPPGPRGNVGFQVAQAGWQIIPTEPGAYFVADDERIVWPVEGQNSSGAWQVIAYNTGTFNHELEFRFLVDLPGGAEAAAPAQPLAAAALGSSFPALSLPPFPGGIELPPLTVPAPPPITAPAPPPGPAIAFQPAFNPAPGLLPAPPGLPASLPGLRVAPPPIVALPPPPVRPTPPAIPAGQAAPSVLDVIEARGQAIQEAQAASYAPNILDVIEARGQAILEAQAASTAAPAQRRGGVQLYI